MIIFINVLIAFFLVIMNGFFVATEFAMVKVRKSRIETLMLQGNKSAKHTLTVVGDLNSYLSACQLGITLASLGLGWVGEPAVAGALEPIFNLISVPEYLVHTISFVLGFTIITAFHIVIGELAPKSLAIISSEKIAMATALPLIMFYKLTYPIMWAFNHSTNLILKIFGVSQVNEHDEAHTDDEIKLLVEDSYKHGLIDKVERTFVDNVFDFSETTVKEIMVPRTDMACIFLDDSLEDIVKYCLKEEFTRYPVCKDSKDNIIGFVHIKDLYKLKFQGNNQSIETIVRQVKFVHESMSISELLKIFKKQKTQIAIVVDEYGGTFGLATIEDILEEIVGEIEDEFDEETRDIVKTEDGSYIVDGKLSLDNINELLEIDINSENIDTIGGWIYSKLKDYPKVNDKIEYGSYEFIILKCNNRRIEQILIRARTIDKLN